MVRLPFRSSSHVLKAVLIPLGFVVLVSAPANAVFERITEREALHITPQTFSNVDLVEGSLQPLSIPSEGLLTPLSAADEFLFQPGERYGRVTIVFTAIEADTNEFVSLNLVIEVFPSAYPILGAFDPDGYSSFGLYFARQGIFQLCDPFPPPGGVLSCDLHRVQGAGEGWVPVYGDWDGDHWNLPSLFDPIRVELHRLAWAADGQELQIEESKRWRNLRWRVPVAGDWRSTGVDSLLLVNMTTGHVTEIQDPFGASQMVTWEVLPLFPGESFLWPFVYRLREIESDQSLRTRETVATVDPASGVGSWLTADGEAYESGFLTAAPVGLSIPIYAERDDLLMVQSFGYLRVRWQPEEGWQREIYFDSMVEGEPNPQTLPLRFPSDPPGG